MCDLTDSQIKEIVFALTLKRKPINFKRWVNVGIKRVKVDGLFSYWKKKINESERMAQFACDTYREYEEATHKLNLNKAVSPPSTVDMAKNLAISMANWAKAGFKMVPEGVLFYRTETCKACPNWEDNAIGGRCLKCGCSTQAKLRLAHEKCPEDKWLPYTGA